MVVSFTLQGDTSNHDRKGKVTLTILCSISGKNLSKSGC